MPLALRKQAARQTHPFPMKERVPLIGSKLRKVRRGTGMLKASQRGVTGKGINLGMRDLGLLRVTMVKCINFMIVSSRNYALSQKESENKVRAHFRAHYKIAFNHQ